MAMIFSIEQAGGEYAVYAREHGETEQELIVSGPLEWLQAFADGLSRCSRDIDDGGLFYDKDDLAEFRIVIDQARRNA